MPKVTSAKSLGVKINERLTWAPHMEETTTKLTTTPHAMYKSFFQPYFDYCSVVWEGLSAKLSSKLQKLQNRAARIKTYSSYDTCSGLGLGLGETMPLILISSLVRQKDQKTLSCI